MTTTTINPTFNPATGKYNFHMADGSKIDWSQFKASEVDFGTVCFDNMPVVRDLDESDRETFEDIAIDRLELERLANYDDDSWKTDVTKWSDEELFDFVIEKCPEEVWQVFFGYEDTYEGEPEFPFKPEYD